MKVAHILPAKFANMLYSTEYHLLISFIVLENEQYANFYRECSEDGDYIILDNGTFEKGHPDTVPNILKAVELVRAKEVVAPDFIKDSLGTMKAVDSFIKELGDSKISVMAVPQGKDWNSWMECYEWMLRNPRVTRIGISIIALDLIFPKEVPATMRRICLLDYLYNKDLMAKPLHLLGMSDNPRELKLISRENYCLVEGLDTSSAWIHGINGYRFDNDRGLSISKIKTKIDFHQTEATKEQLDNVRYNIQIMNEWSK